MNLRRIYNAMRPAEKLVFSVSACVLIVTGLILISRVNDYFSVEEPAFGGSFKEGVIGKPRFINPVLSISEADKDLTSLVYSGLIKKTEMGLQPGLAESYTVSEDGLVYEFTLKKRSFFHDGQPVTTDDILFTIQKMTDPVIKSNKSYLWAGIQTEKLSDQKIRFTLHKPFSGFISGMDFGILPKHIWKDISSEDFAFSDLNIMPIGSGQYKVDSISTGPTKVPSNITLVAFRKNTKDRPLIGSITFLFYEDEDDLANAISTGEVTNTSDLSTHHVRQLPTGIVTNKASLPRIFGFYFNHNENQLFLNKEIREALQLATPKQRIIDEVLGGFGKPINGPAPYLVEGDTAKLTPQIDTAKAILAKAGWAMGENGFMVKKNGRETAEFKFTVSTLNTQDLRETARILKESWAAIGANVEIKVYEADDFTRDIIRPRKYESLLFGEIIESDSDLFPFWHSSARGENGLNISMYTNVKVDMLLEELQSTLEREERAVSQKQIFDEINRDIPAIFLFTPEYIYLSTNQIHEISLGKISAQSERFGSIGNWYIETDRVWKIFAKKVLN